MTRQGRAKRTQHTRLLSDEPVDDAPVYSLFKLTSQHTKPMLVTLQVNQADLEMGVDTGASVSVIN